MFWISNDWSGPYKLIDKIDNLSTTIRKKFNNLPIV